MDPFETEIARAIDPQPPAESAPHRPRRPARLLFAAPAAEHDPALLQHLESRGDCCIRVERLDQAIALIQSDRFELVLLSPRLEGDPAELSTRLAELAPATKIVLVSSEPTAETAIAAMRLGAVDLIRTPVDEHELPLRIDAALAKSRHEQRREHRLTRLKVVCRELNVARREIAEQLDALCEDMASAYRGMNEQMSEIAMASEFRTLIRQELDVEDLLRTALEYALTKTGPTNAAVFLAEGQGRYSLGAYVNFDCPRETIAEVLDRLGSAVCPQMAEEPEIISFEDAREFAQWLDIETGMLAESQVIAFSCMHEDECLAVIVLFRSMTKPFDESLRGVIETLRPILAAQLANVVRIHHRAVPSWPKEARGGEDEFGFNDEMGFGFGGLAA